ncbi:MAG: nucleotidyltransferase family protein [Terriglobales bacterium]
MLSPPPSTVPLNRTASFELLCACSAAQPNPQQIARIARWRLEDFNWEEFLCAAEHHGVSALVARNLIEHTATLPSEIRRSLDSIYVANFRRSLWFAAELMRITRAFAQNQIRAIPYKGPVLAQSAYGDLALRSFSDLDLLITPADFSRAKQTLAELGYQPSKPQTPAVERLWLCKGYERSFDGPAGKNLIELQWNLLPYFYAVDPAVAEFRFDDLWIRTGRIALGAHDESRDTSSNTLADASGLPCLSPEDSLLILCLHAAKHLWTRLIWIADIAESLRVSDLDSARVVERSRALGITRILAVSFWLAEHLLGAAIPSAAQPVMDDDPAAPRLGEECVARLARGATYDFESTEYFRETLRLRERRPDRMRYLWRLVWTPGPGDIDAVALPEFMFPLYHGIRIGRLLQKLARSNRRRPAH